MSYTTNYCLEYDLYLDRSAACGICMENAYFLQFLLLLSLIPVSALTSAWLVAKFVYEPHVRRAAMEEDWSDDEEEEEELYEDKYCLDFVKQSDDKKNHINLMVQESTPDGSVFMKWNEDNESFDYWCDNKEIKYMYLEVVARKYCTMFGCPEIYIDRGKDIQRQKELEKQAEEKAKMEEEDKKEEEEADSDDELFAKLKKPEEVKKSVAKKKVKTAAVRSNKYRRVGKISEMVLLQEVKSKEEPKKKMTFSDWVSFSKTSKTV